MSRPARSHAPAHWIALALVAAGCAGGAPGTDSASTLGGTARVTVQDGGFESGTNDAAPPGWTVTPYLNPGITLSTPQTRAGLNLQTSIAGAAAPSALTYALVTAGGTSSQTDAYLGASATLRWPAVGAAAALVNRGGINRNANAMKQSFTLEAGDVDPVDGLRHLRLLLAPVLQDPGHNTEEQPYVFVGATRVSGTEKTLYTDFRASGQGGLPWRQVAVTATNIIRYTDWSLIDVPLDPADGAPGTVVELEVIAAGCSRNAHWGAAYVDEVGASVARPIVFAKGPTAVNEDSNLTYTVSYENASPSDAAGVVIEFNTPSGTTFQGLNAPGLTCTLPSAGAAGMVSCAVGSLPSKAYGQFTLTVHVDPATSGTVITAANYDVAATGLTTLLGSRVDTAVTSGVTYADLGVTVGDGLATVAAGAPLTYTVTVSNAGPGAVAGARVSASLPAQLTGAAWTCVGAGGASCTSSGSGAIDDSATSLPVGGTLTYTLSGAVSASAPAGQLGLEASVTPPSGVVDAWPLDDVAIDDDRITVANGAGCSSAADCTGGVCSASDGLCGYADGAGPCTAADQAGVCRSGRCGASLVCIPAEGCLVDADCPGGWCDGSALQCKARAGNGEPLPGDAGHGTPVLDGTCSAAAAALVCESGVCDQGDQLCGYADGTGPCTAGDAASVCRSGICAVSGARAGTCVACATDADCAGATPVCDVDAGVCAARSGGGGGGGCASGPAGAVALVLAALGLVRVRRR